LWRRENYFLDVWLREIKAVKQSVLNDLVLFSQSINVLSLGPTSPFVIMILMTGSKSFHKTDFTHNAYITYSA
jgi:hypothetical protein